MSKDPEHGGPGWSLGTCLWAPRYSGKNPTDERHWGFWDTLQQVEVGDRVLHLRYPVGRPAFVGHSFVAKPHCLTNEQPPAPGQWADGRELQRVELDGFTQWHTPVPLADVFRRQEQALRDYNERRRSESKRHKRPVFFSVSSGRLQVTMGAYFSHIDKDLASILENAAVKVDAAASSSTDGTSVRTGSRAATIMQRDGQEEWRQAIGDRCGWTCAFPGCGVDEPTYLVAGHVARWADAEDLRGRTDNGLLWCRLHDAAFESGHFTIDETGQIHVTPHLARIHSSWLKGWLDGPSERRVQPELVPSRTALEAHWDRTGLWPSRGT